MENTVLVNATSCAGGALKVIDEFVDMAWKDISQMKNKKYYFFVPSTYFSNVVNQQIIFIKNEENLNYKSRNYWNLYGMSKWIELNNINSFELISLQNYFPFRVIDKASKKSLYLHQSIPFYPYKWKLNKKEERNLWFYKNIYYYLIKFSIIKCDVLYVQTEWFKEKVRERISTNVDKIIVKRPVLNWNIDNTTVEKEKDKLKLFYPAGDMIYKNHKVLIEAMNILVNEKKIKNIFLFFTLSEDSTRIVNLIKNYKLENNIILTGNLAISEVIEYYKTVDVLVFPSKIETFGFPLIEAQCYKLPIISNDFSLFKEVIGDYSEKVLYCEDSDPYLWANAIKEFIK